MNQVDRKNQVPLRQKSVNDIGQRYYETPGKFHGKVKVAVAPDWYLSCDPKRAKPVTPAENMMAFILPLGVKTE